MMDWSLSGLSKTQQNPGVVSHWAIFEGQLLHDMISYVHRLKRNHENSYDADIADLKAFVPDTPRTRRTSKSAEMSPTSSAIETPRKETTARENEDTQQSDSLPTDEVTHVPDSDFVNSLSIALAQHNPDLPWDRLRPANFIAQTFGWCSPCQGHARDIGRTVLCNTKVDRTNI